ncbi:hypothetical protein GIB67_019178 [Kingdonia uniflora]|uniref:EF-hand domain-containing protein n=1 Tax=Kingdonia uniflora TaxID=39325 RepID=A0A7J7MZM7_9MAGN|nr:hypothetical protein GIB67_019178 [Kingdonia uniflora]
MARDDLASPLLLKSFQQSPHHLDVVVDIVSDESSTTTTSASDLGESDNPFEFLGADCDFRVPQPTPLNPFRNYTPHIEGIYEWLKITICIPIAIIRLICFGLAISVGFVATKIALYRWKDRKNPMPQWRCRVLWITRFCTRCILFCFGYHWIRRKGRPAPREIAPIVVSNHVSYIEPIFFFYELFPTIVASESHDSIPFVGTIIRAMQVIYVDRFSASSRKHAVSEIKIDASSHWPESSVLKGVSFTGVTTGDEPLVHVPNDKDIDDDGAFGSTDEETPVVESIATSKPKRNMGKLEWLTKDMRKASCEKFPRLLLFPEGTTTNGKVLISFQLGAFIPGYPIQPVVVRYPHVHFDQSWGDISLGKLMFRMFTQFHNFMEIEYLPVVVPLENQKENAIHLAERTSYAIANALNVVQTSHSYGDIMLLTKASQSKQEKASSYMVEMARMENSLNISTLEAIDFLDAFLSMNPNRSGNVQLHDFLRVFRLRECPLSKKLGDYIQPAIPDLSDEEVRGLFSLFDRNCDGKISKGDFMTCLRKNPLLVALFSPSLLHRDYLEADGDVGLSDVV